MFPSSIWAPPDASTLWLYQLHQFDWVRADSLAPSDRAGDITSWIDGHPEPQRWSVEVYRKDEERPRSGTVGVLLGGPSSGPGHHEWDDLVVTGADGTVLVREDFDDPASFGANWEAPCNAVWNSGKWVTATWRS